MRGLGISDEILRQMVGVRGGGPYLGPNGSPLSQADFNTLNTYWDRYRGAGSFIGATGPYAWMNTDENPVDKRAWNYLNANWGIIRGAKYFTDINWGDPRLVGLPDYYYEVYPQAMAAEPLPEVGPASPAPAAPAPLVTSPNFPTSSGGGSGGGGYTPYFSSEPLPDTLQPTGATPATPVQAGMFSDLFSKVPPWLLALVAAGLAMPVILGKTPSGRRRRRR